MNRFWIDFIKPILECTQAKHILEIGCDQGNNTSNLINYCKENNGIVYGIDPVPSEQVMDLQREHEDIFKFYQDTSLNAITKLSELDAVLIDGDHNWYTVYNELLLIEKHFDKFPITLLHDIGWPYARRDMYYNPENIPGAYLKPYKKKGIKFGQPKLCDYGGINASFNNSIYENSLRNGVHTAVEDFINDSNLELRFVKIDGFNGLGILIDKNKVNENRQLDLLLNGFEVSEAISNHLVRLDENIANKHSELLDLKYHLNINNNHLIDQSEKIKKITKELNTVEIENNDIKVQFIQEKNRLEKEIIILKENVSILGEKITEQNSIINQKEESNKQLGAINNQLNSQINQLNQKQDEYFEYNKKLEALVYKLHLGVSDILSSKRWKIGNFIGNSKSRLILRKPSNSGHSFLIKTLNEIPESVIDITNNDTVSYSKKDILLYSFKSLFKRSLKTVLKNYKAYRVIKNSGQQFFDEMYYLLNNNDVRSFKLDPLIHYLYFGGFEGRNPSKHFDGFEYLQSNKDVKESKINPLVHYVLYGKSEGRKLFKDSRESLNNLTNIESAKKSAMITISEKVSIIMPTFNRANIIKKAINSVLTQTYSNFELIIIDDGSTDKTDFIINQYYSNDLLTGRIKYIKQPNSGVSAARNIGLSQSSGEFIAYLDSDNEWQSTFLEDMLNAFKLEKCNTLYCGIEVFDSYRNKHFTRQIPYNRDRLLEGNFIDLNCFMHKQLLFKQYGGFDTSLERLVDWDFILKITKLNPPAFVNKILVKYYLDEKLNNISNTVSLDINKEKVLGNHRQERISKKTLPLKIAYVLWDFPSFSQTFVLNELRYLINMGYDVKVYYKTSPDKKATLDFNIDYYQVNDSEDLIKILIRDDRNLIHSHFVYPACTLLAYPAAERLKIPFTVMAHAVDIYHHNNDKRNRIREISQSRFCKKVFVLGEYPKNYLLERGVPAHKIMKIRQAVRYDLVQEEEIYNSRRLKDSKNIITITRFVEKKGITDLINAARILRNSEYNFIIYGYGPLEDELRTQVKELKLNNVSFPGPLNSFSEVKNAYSNADLFILPCIQAENGDMDGLPTVLLEAMAFGVPVISTNISVIPEVIKDNYSGFIVDQRNPQQIAEKIEEVTSIPRESLVQILINARNTVDTVANISDTISSLVDIWEDNIVDIFMVTYNTDEYNDLENTQEIIRRIFYYTSTPFNLTLVDNGSNKEFIQFLRGLCVEYPNIRLIELEENVFCGPASNIALDHSSGAYSIYVCSKEGFVSKLGWERELINYMNKNERVGIAGEIVFSPSFHNGETYISQQWFNKFRNQEYAHRNLKKKLGHVQGGIYILRNRAYQDCGGFNLRLPHHYMDVEYSYYLESCGWLLGSIPSVQSVTIKTRPLIDETLDENVVAAHPLSLKNVELLDFYSKGRGKACNLCGWRGESFLKQELICPNCNGTAANRALYRYLARSNLIYRGLNLLLISKNSEFFGKLDNLFGEVTVCNVKECKAHINSDKYEVIIILDGDFADFDILASISSNFFIFDSSIINPSNEFYFTEAGYEKQKISFTSLMQGISLKGLIAFSK